MTSAAPRLSIIVTSYNIEPYIGECLDSIVNQSLRDIEIIVVDDGSSDGSPGIIRDYADRDGRIVPILFETNTIGGVGSAANAGLDRARGRYVGFADGDDLYDADMFEKLLEAAERDDADLAMCKYKLLDAQTGQTSDPAEVQRWDGYKARTYPLDEAGAKALLKFIAVPWRKIYRRAMIEEQKIRFPVGDYFYEDNPFHWAAVLSARSVAMVPEVLCYHRVARIGQTMQTADERLFRMFLHHDTIRDRLVAQGHEPAYRLALLGWTLSQMEWISRVTPEPLYRALFDTLRATFGPYALADFEASFADTKRGQRGQDLARAVVADRFSDFYRILENRPDTPSLFQEGLFHLRHFGVGHTARLTARYAKARLSERGMGGTLRRLVPGRSSSSSAEISNTDLAFALTVLERRLHAIETELARQREGRKDG